MKINSQLAFSISVSMAIHAAFFASSDHIRIRGIEQTAEYARRMFDVQLVEKRAPITVQQVFKTSRYREMLKFERPFGESDIPYSHAGDKSVPERQARGVLGTLLERKQPAHLDRPLARAADYAEETPDMRERKRSVMEDLIERPVIGSGPSGPPRPLDNDAVPVEFAKEMPGYTPIAADSSAIRETLGKISSQALRESLTQPDEKYQILDQYLLADLETYQAPESGKKYFRITLMAGKDIDKFKTMPKEMIFLIDCSLSMQANRMGEFKEGLRYCVKNLSPGDVFNVISFKEDIHKFSPELIKARDRDTKQVARFIQDLAPAESTDVYRALMEIIKTPSTIRPSYVFLLSDGRPTIGITDSREIIAAINRINARERVIFSYSGGVRVNRYLLDFIAYSNRGWSEYAPRTERISLGLEAFYDKVRDPVLINLKYRFSGVSAQKVYPKGLPDFFKGASFTLLGTYEDEDEFSMQLLGDAFGERKEFIFSGRLSEAGKGSSEIARQWAFNKIYYLIGQLA